MRLRFAGSFAFSTNEKLLFLYNDRYYKTIFRFSTVHVNFDLKLVDGGLSYVVTTRGTLTEYNEETH